MPRGLRADIRVETAFAATRNECQGNRGQRSKDQESKDQESKGQENRGQESKSRESKRGSTLRIERIFGAGHGVRRIAPMALAALWACCASFAGAQTQAPVGSISAVSQLSNAQASQRPPADFEATVTYFRGLERTLFVEENGAAIYVNAVTDAKLVPGDRVRVRGTVHPSFRPYVDSRDVTLLAHGAPPKAEPATFEEMIRAEKDCHLVTVHATIRSADIAPSVLSTVPTAFLQMLVDGGQVDGTLDSADADALSGLLDADVEITGVASGEFDNKMQQTGVLLHVQRLADVKILKRANVDPWALPITPMDRMILGYDARDLTQRIHIHGTITYYEPGHALVLQNGNNSAWVSTSSFLPLQLGEAADAIGFPDVQNGFMRLTHSEVKDRGLLEPILPPVYTAQELASGGNDAHGHNFDLVSVEGQVVAAVRQASEDDYLLKDGDRLFSATFEHPKAAGSPPLPTMKEISPNTRIRVTGICMLENANPFNGEVPFSILMRNFDDVQVVAKPGWISVEHLTTVVVLLLVAIFFIGIWHAFGERRARRKIATLAYVEQRRGKILEDVNNGRPLAEILERITELVSLRLDGAPCWCQVAEGARLGNCPAELSTAALRIVERPIPSRSGASLGTICTSFDVSTTPRAVEQEALSLATGLATLAIETSRLYSDLVHRSEFDLLTDIQNRFSLEKYLDKLIVASRQAASIFGLLYIDLNDFKQVNDVYGHRAGDLYLQQVSTRMKRQLRPGDMLARLGGDEFAVLVADVRCREDADEIAHRLRGCFDIPFEGDGYVINGSASVGIATYPADGTSKDELLSAADAAMYVSKQTRSRRQRAERAEMASGERR